ncbi:predicted protein [Chaetoceros tenuissimus]|uniref:Uncharacterized protein n=1 Tax=Chaetoceros tenuissimus TaxID=426638 RepID=A0AAD3CMV4_9STRA|nr:predicted protein [Chaetoceros tenuissimus]
MKPSTKSESNSNKTICPSHYSMEMSNAMVDFPSSNSRSLDDTSLQRDERSDLLRTVAQDTSNVSSMCSELEKNEGICTLKSTKRRTMKRKPSITTNGSARNEAFQVLTESRKSASNNVFLSFLQNSKRTRISITPSMANTPSAKSA